MSGNSKKDNDFFLYRDPNFPDKRSQEFFDFLTRPQDMTPFERHAPLHPMTNPAMDLYNSAPSETLHAIKLPPICYQKNRVKLAIALPPHPAIPQSLDEQARWLKEGMVFLIRDIHNEEISIDRGCQVCKVSKIVSLDENWTLCAFFFSFFSLPFTF